MPDQFNGHIALDVRDSTPDWTPYSRRGARRRAERADRPLRRHRPGRLVAVRRADPHADHAAARRQRADLHAVAHDGALLADALLLPHRPQPPPERVRLHRRGRHRLPGRERPHPRENGTIAAGAARTTATTRTGSARTTTSRPRRTTPAAPKSQLAAAAGLRPLLRLPRRRDQPVVSDAGRGQPLDRPAVPARGRLPPLQGPRRPGAADAARQPAAAPSRPWFMWFCPGANHAPAPRRPGVGRQVQGPVRRRLRGVPRVGARRA